MTIDTKKEIETKVRKILVRVYAHAYDDAQQKLRIEDVDEAHRKDADIYVNELMAILESFAEKREKEEQAKIEELFQDTKSHFDYWLSPRDMDAFWATFGQRVYKYFGLPIKEENQK